MIGSMGAFREKLCKPSMVGHDVPVVTALAAFLIRQSLRGAI